MRSVRVVVKGVLLVIALLLMVAGTGTFLRHKPFLLEVERTNSMYPLLQRGYVVLLVPVTLHTQLHIGEIIMYHPPVGPLSKEGFIVHRLVGGNARMGYITKGDHNLLSDQAAMQAPPVQPAWIVNRVVTIGGRPLAIPLVGYPTLWLQSGAAKRFYFVPIIGALVAIIVSTGGIRKRERHRRSRRLRRYQGSIFLLSGLTLMLMMAAIIINSSQTDEIPYVVSLHQNGVLNGGGVGIVRKGTVIHRPLATLNNFSDYPSVATITAEDPQLVFSETQVWLPPHATATPTLTLDAKHLGFYKSIVHIGIFPGILPASWIGWIAHRNYWLAVVAVSCIPGLPFFIFPLLHSRIRRNSMQRVRRLIFG
ncbi:S26 family signal peptidase [Sulfoacidibacillus ferrooxidans]|uniref:Signal peptidase I n=1 Tax=Sulfoacidibacillus ferrooxidans TaxID=2005001 RepID=A0A9X1V9Y9_9BACL|nr:S26 family signal peptidase [Sulfoacidibacillus ferrooxidans]MCI0183440.1 hypothetical protein [Sulfoacidibacillus ferrooxidans]